MSLELRMEPESLGPVLVKPPPRGMDMTIRAFHDWTEQLQAFRNPVQQTLEQGVSIERGTLTDRIHYDKHVRNLKTKILEKNRADSDTSVEIPTARFTEGSCDEGLRWIEC